MIEQDEANSLTDSDAENYSKNKCEKTKLNQFSELPPIGTQSDLKTSGSSRNDNSLSHNKLKSDCKSNIPKCHNTKTNLKTDNLCDRSSTSSLINTVNKSNSVPFTSVSSVKIQNNTKKVKDSHVHQSPYDSKDISISTFRTESPRREENKSSEVGKSQYKNPFAAFREIDSDEETVCFDDFITIDKIDTAKSYLRSPPLPFDDYNIIDMDISPFKRKSEDEEDTGIAKKIKYDNVYYRINSERLLNEVNEVLRENKQHSEKNKVESSKRFRSKSLTFHDTEGKKSVVRSFSTDSVDKTKFHVSYNFDLKTNLLLLLNQNSTGNIPSDFDNIFKILKGVKGEKLSGSKIASIENISAKNVTNSNFDGDSQKRDTSQVNEKKDCALGIKENTPILLKKENDRETNTKIEQNETEQNITNPYIKTKPDQQSIPTSDCNEKNSMAKDTKYFLGIHNTKKNDLITQPKIEKENCSESNSKRKILVNTEIQTKKICLNSIEETIIQSIRASDIEGNFESDKEIKESSTDVFNTTGCTKSDSILEKSDNNCHPDKNEQTNICNNGKSESMVDIEEELTSLLAIDSSNIYQEKCDVKSTTENSSINIVINDDINNVSDINKKGIESENETEIKYTETSNVVESKNPIASENPVKKEIRPPTTEKSNQSEGKTDVKDGLFLNSTHPKSKQESLRKQSVADKKQKFTGNYKVDRAMDAAITTSLSQSVNKTAALLQKPLEKQSVSKSKTVNYYKHFKRIQSLFGSDSESELEEEKLVSSKTSHNSSIKKICEDSKKKVQLEKQVPVTGININVENPIKSKKSAENYIKKHDRHFSKTKVIPSTKKSSKAIEKRRCSVPIGDTSSNDMKTSSHMQNKNESVSSVKVKRIEKKRRETLPASLIGESFKNKPHHVEDVEAQNCTKLKESETPTTSITCSTDVLTHKKDDSENVIIDHKLRDPRKEHFRYRNSIRKEYKKEISNASQIQTVNRQTVLYNSCELQLKNTEKYKSHHEKEKKPDTFPQNATSKNDNENRKGNGGNSKEKKVKNNLKEKGSTQKKENPASVKIMNQLENHSVQSESSKGAVAVDFKALHESKIKVATTSKLKKGTEIWEELKFLQCLALPKRDFPLLQRASFCIQENDCCDRAVTLENVDVTDRIEVVKQIVINQEDDVIEIKQDIPIIDLTDDSIKEKIKNIPKTEIENVNHEIPYKTDEMITLYRSEETVNSSLDVQVTSESISPIVLMAKKGQTQDLERVDNLNKKSNIANPTTYISSLSANVSAQSSVQFTFDSSKKVGNNTETQSMNKPIGNITSSSASTQILKDTESFASKQNHESTYNASQVQSDIQTNLTHNCTSYIEINNRVNLAPTVPVQKYQENVIKPPIKIPFIRQNMAQQNPMPTSDPLTKMRQKVDNINKMMNTRIPLEKRQNSMAYHQIMMNSSNARSTYSIHSPMRHTDEEGPTPMHEIGIGEIRKVSLILIKYLYFFDGMRKAQWAYMNELQKLQKHMPVTTRTEIYQFENYNTEKDSVLCKNLIRDLKSLNPTAGSNNVLSVQMVMEFVFKSVQKVVNNLTISWIYLMLESLMQSEVSEYMSVPFLRDLYNFVAYVTGKIRNTRQMPTQTRCSQVVTPRMYYDII